MRICGDIEAFRDKFRATRDKKVRVGAAAMPLGVCAGRVKKLLGRSDDRGKASFGECGKTVAGCLGRAGAVCAGVGLLVGHACGRGLWYDRRHS